MEFLRRLFGGPSKAALAHAHEQAEIARLKGINRDPPPGEGWRVAPQDSEGKWTVWKDDRPIASFWREFEAADMVVRLNGRPAGTLDGEYCVMCGSRETLEAIQGRGHVSCCPERRIVREVWTVTGEKLATGQWHIFKPAEGLDTITDDGWLTRAEAQNEADRRNLREALIRVDFADLEANVMADLSEGLTAAKLARPFADTRQPEDVVRLDPYVERATQRAAGLDFTPAIREIRETKAEWLNVTIPEGVKAVVGPLRNPDDGKWYTFDRAGPMRGYSHRSDANRAARRINAAP